MATFIAQYTRDLTRKRKRWKDGTATVLPARVGGRRKIVVKSEDGRSVLSGYLPKSFAKSHDPSALLDEEFQVEHYIVRLDEISHRGNDQPPPSYSSASSSASARSPSSSSARSASAALPKSHQARRPIRKMGLSRTTSSKRTDLGLSDSRRQYHEHAPQHALQAGILANRHTPGGGSRGPSHQSSNFQPDNMPSTDDVLRSFRERPSSSEPRQGATYTNDPGLVPRQSLPHHHSHHLEEQRLLHHQQRRQATDPGKKQGKKQYRFPQQTTSFGQAQIGASHENSFAYGSARSRPRTGVFPKGKIPSTDDVLKNLRLKFNRDPESSATNKVPSDASFGAGVGKQNPLLNTRIAPAILAVEAPPPFHETKPSRQTASVVPIQQAPFAQAELQVKLARQQPRARNDFDDLLVCSDEDDEDEDDGMIVSGSSNPSASPPSTFNWNRSMSTRASLDDASLRGTAVDMPAGVGVPSSSAEFDSFDDVFDKDFEHNFEKPVQHANQRKQRFQQHNQGHPQHHQQHQKRSIGRRNWNRAKKEVSPTAYSHNSKQTYANRAAIISVPDMGQEVVDLSSDVDSSSSSSSLINPHPASDNNRSLASVTRQKFTGGNRRSIAKASHLQLQFPSVNESNCFGSIGTSAWESVANAIPDTCSTPDEYAGALVRALVGELQLALNDYATTFWQSAAQIGLQASKGNDAVASVPNCDCNKPCKLAVSRSDRNPNRPFFKCATSQQKGKKKKNSQRSKYARGGKSQQGCNFFKWADAGANSRGSGTGQHRNNIQLIKSKSPEMVQRVLAESAALAQQNPNGFLTMMRAHMIAFYSGCTLKVHGPKASAGGSGDEEEDDRSHVEQRRFFLHVPEDQLESNKVYAIGQVWMISKINPVSLFSNAAGSSSYWFMRSSFFAPTPDGMLGMRQMPGGWSRLAGGIAWDPLKDGGDFKGRASLGRPGPPKAYVGAKNMGLFAIRLPDSFTLEFDSIDVLSSMLASVSSSPSSREANLKTNFTLSPCRLLPALLDPSGTSLAGSEPIRGLDGIPPTRLAVQGVPMRLTLPASDVERLAKECISRFTLNFDQASVLKHVASWFVDSNTISSNKERSGLEQEACYSSSEDEIDRIMHSQGEDDGSSEKSSATERGGDVDPKTCEVSLQGGPSTPVLLVHGVFGAGKSFLVVVLIIFIREYVVRHYRAKYAASLSSSSSSSSSTVSPSLSSSSGVLDVRIMIAAATNVAVDGLLKTLLKQGFTDFARVGRHERIAPEVRKHEHKGSSIINKSVVGITCASVHNKTSIMATVKTIGCFDILFLDECSQMIEPQSLLPIYASQCSRMVLVGDPMQLPPVVKYSGSRSRGASQSDTPPNSQVQLQNRHRQQQQQQQLLEKEEREEGSQAPGIERALFVRLSKNLSPIMLRTQYRCHPSIGQLSSSLFYGGRLRSGVSESDRSPILSLAPIVAYDTRMGVDHRKSIKGQWSYENEAEAEAVCRLVTMALEDGIAPNDIGVITMFRAQTALIEQKIAAIDVGSIVDGVLERRQREVDEADEAAEAAELEAEAAADRQDLEEEDRKNEDLEKGEGGGLRKRKASISKMPKKKRPKKRSTKKRTLSKRALLARNHIKVSTVDAFQGAEREIIILSTTRTSFSSGSKSSAKDVDSNHLRSPHRLNVALTRARRHLLIVGHLRALYSHGGSVWKRIITQLDTTKCIFMTHAALFENDSRGELRQRRPMRKAKALPAETGPTVAEPAVVVKRRPEAHFDEVTERNEIDIENERVDLPNDSGGKGSDHSGRDEVLEVAASNTDDDDELLEDISLE